MKSLGAFAAAFSLALLSASGKQAIDHDLLRDGALELVEDEVDRVELRLQEAGDDPAGDELRLLEVQPVVDAHEVVRHLAAAAREVLATLAAEGDERDVRAGRLLLAPRALAGLVDVRVERAAETAVRREDHVERAGLRAHREQRMDRLVLRFGGGGHGARHRLEHLARLHGVRAHRDDALLRSRQLGARHHLHGAGDLLRRLRADDALADPLEGGHGDYFFPSPVPNAVANSSSAFLRVVSVSASTAFFVRIVS